MKPGDELIELAKRIRALATIGGNYSLSEYDTERYSELTTIADRIMSVVSGADAEEISSKFSPDGDYLTPKVDIRAVVFNGEGEILMVRERADGLWSLPGGWADIGYSPAEVAVKEVKEETGFDVSARKLLALHDKKLHGHGPSLRYVYKIFIMCEITGGSPAEAFDILETGFFSRHNLPPLSIERVTNEQVDLMFEYLLDPCKPTDIE